MLTQSNALTFTRTVQAPPAEAFRAFTVAHALRGWLCNAAEVDAREGGRIYLWWDEGFFVAGTFTSFERDKRLTFNWCDASGAFSEMSVSFTPEGAGTAVTLTNNGEVSDETTEMLRRMSEDGLENLQSWVETGVDLRFVRRPMFGLSGADVLTRDSELVKRLGVPVTEGIWIEGLVDGMGAQAAGIQKDDVVISLGGKETPNWASFTAALQPPRAGDKVEVVFYRGPERHAVDVELSKRPLTEPPAAISELVAKMGAGYVEVDAELAKCVEGATEAQAEYRDAPNNWNAKEVLAHLIAGERDVHTWIASMVEDDRVDLRFYSNTKERLTPVVKAYPTLTELVAEVYRTEMITVEMLAALSEKTLAHKHFYRQLADSLSNFDHNREHIKEIARLLAAAKG